MPGQGSDFRTDYYEPAVQGTQAILDAASAAPSVKKVIVVSSILALMPLDGLTDPGLKITENVSSLIPVDPNMAFPEGLAGHSVKYQASKILAHRATLDWFAGHGAAFQLITFHPTFVIGHDMTQTDAVPRGPNAYLMRSLTSEKPMIPASFVDVHDVAEAHLRAITAVFDGSPTEIILGGKPTTWEDTVNLIKARYPTFPVKLSGPFSAPFSLDADRAEQVLGVKWRETEATVASVLDQQLQLQRAARI